MKSAATLDRTKLCWLAAMLAPTAVVFGVRLLAGVDGPAESSAQSHPPAPSASNQAAAIAPSVHARSRAELAAIAYLREHPIVGPIKSPMEEPPPVVLATSEPDTVAPPIAPDIAAPPRLRITAIVESSRETVAAIGHRLLRVGDPAAPGWTIISIDARSRAVRLRHEDGRTAEYSTFDPGTPRE